MFGVNLHKHNMWVVERMEALEDFISDENVSYQQLCGCVRLFMLSALWIVALCFEFCFPNGLHKF